MNPRDARQRIPGDHAVEDVNVPTNPEPALPPGHDWAWCTPELLAKTGASCGEMLRRPGPNGEGHEHHVYVGPAAASATTADTSGGCPGDPVECGYGAALGEAQVKVERLKDEAAARDAELRRVASQLEYVSATREVAARMDREADAEVRQLREQLDQANAALTELRPASRDSELREQIAAEGEAWLKAQRDSWGMDTDRPEWVALDQALDDYRLHMHTGTPLDEHACEGGCDPNTCPESLRDQAEYL